MNGSTRAAEEGSMKRDGAKKRKSNRRTENDDHKCLHCKLIETIGKYGEKHGKDAVCDGNIVEAIAYVLAEVTTNLESWERQEKEMEDQLAEQKLPN
jgi:hypothetical protein